jgi:phosphatidylserine decarboxylase
MHPIKYINRTTKKVEVENVYGEKAIRFLYSNKSALSNFLCKLLASFAFFSHFYGFLQKRPSSKKKIKPFIENYKLDVKEFLDPVESFKSFNDFFIRKLKKEARPINAIDTVAIIPADGRYLFYPNVEKADGFVVKGKKFTLEKLIGNKELANVFKEGSLIIARLCPLDYHRYHFPLDCLPKETHLINGPLYSVNPLAIKQNVELLAENKRTYTLLETKNHGKVLYMEVGATSVGSIHQTYKPNDWVKKGDEKGYFSFGGSTLILLFEKDRIQFDEDLLEASKDHIEIYCKMGQSMGVLR